MFKATRKLKDIAKRFLKPTNQLLSLEIDRYILDHLTNNPKYSARALQRFEFQTFSQNGEDGIISEIFRRIGTTNKSFVEFGVESGVENNSANLLLNGWNGLWMEGSPKFHEEILRTREEAIQSGRLSVIRAFVHAENIEELLRQGNVPVEPDLLSIDVDGNDWYIWRAIVSYHPRVVVVEYNGHFQPTDDFIVTYDKSYWWDGSFYFGASLKAFCLLAETKGYSLVGCDFTGTNAFFVRTDLVDDHFEGPFTPEKQYEPMRYFLNRRLGHPQRVGNFESAAVQLSRNSKSQNK
jgi:hypothetical protein